PLSRLGHHGHHRPFGGRGVTTSHAVFTERSKSTYEALDAVGGRNVYRVLPEHFFCSTLQEGRCVTHTTDTVYYSDDDHLSAAGARMVVDEIFRQIGGETDVVAHR